MTDIYLTISIKMDFQAVGWGGMDWFDLAQEGGR